MLSVRVLLALKNNVMFVIVWELSNDFFELGFAFMKFQN